MSIHVIQPTLTEETGGLHVAPASAWTRLSAALRSLAQSREIIENDAGEVIDRTPENVANTVANGAIWIDYCGWPMYWQRSGIGVGLGGPGVPLGGDGMTRFLRQIYRIPPAYGNGAGPVFEPPAGVIIPGGYSRALIISTRAQDAGIAVPSGSEFRPEHPQIARDGNFAWVYPMFGIPYGAGWYFYACGNTLPYPRFGGSMLGAEPAGRTVDPDAYASFILSQVHAARPSSPLQQAPPVQARPQPTQPGQPPTPQQPVPSPVTPGVPQPPQLQAPAQPAGPAGGLSTEGWIALGMIGLGLFLITSNSGRGR